MQLSSEPAEENASDENKDETTSLAKDEDNQNSNNTPPDAETPPGAPIKLEEDVTVTTPEDVLIKPQRKLHYTPDVVKKLESDTTAALIASVNDTRDISELDKALIALLPDPPEEKIASTYAQADTNKKITALIDIVGVLQNTVTSQRKLFEAEKYSQRRLFEAEKDSMHEQICTFEADFKDVYGKRLNDVEANLMHETEKKIDQQEKHIVTQIDQQLLSINNDMAVMNAYVGSKDQVIVHFRHLQTFRSKIYAIR